MVVGKNTPEEHAPLLGPLQIKKNDLLETFG